MHASLLRTDAEQGSTLLRYRMLVSCQCCLHTPNIYLVVQCYPAQDTELAALQATTLPAVPTGPVGAEGPQDSGRRSGHRGAPGAASFTAAAVSARLADLQRCQQSTQAHGMAKTRAQLPISAHR